MSDYYVRHLHVSLPLAAADKIADGVLAAGAAEGLLPLTVSVLDAGGNLVVMKRGDGCGILRGDIATGWDFTVLHSNSQRTHELDKTHDWVVISYHQDHESEAQCTAVTETRGTLAAYRVVRGREGDCTMQQPSRQLTQLVPAKRAGGLWPIQRAPCKGDG